MAINAERPGIDFGDPQRVVLSHGHGDHAGGFNGLLRLRCRHQTPVRDRLVPGYATAAPQQP
ncbi:MAG: MBL fold metallo-hydrolase [Candidatus Dormibacteria bacterium]